MNDRENELKGSTVLGKENVSYKFDYDPSILKTFVNKHRDNDYFVKFNCPEFTSLCPITGQPDFASVYISYVPDKLMVESKSRELPPLIEVDGFLVNIPNGTSLPKL